MAGFHGKFGDPVTRAPPGAGITRPLWSSANKHSAAEQTFAHGNVPAGVSLFNRSSLHRDPFREIIANGGTVAGDSGSRSRIAADAFPCAPCPLPRRRRLFADSQPKRATTERIQRVGFIFPVADHVAREIANEQTPRSVSSGCSRSTRALSPFSVPSRNLRPPLLNFRRSRRQKREPHTLRLLRRGCPFGHRSH